MSARSRKLLHPKLLQLLRVPRKLLQLLRGAAQTIARFSPEKTAKAHLKFQNVNYCNYCVHKNKLLQNYCVWFCHRAARRFPKVIPLGRHLRLLGKKRRPKVAPQPA